MTIWVECPRGNMFEPEAIYVYTEKIVFLCRWQDCPDNEDCPDRDGRTITLKEVEGSEKDGE